MKKTEQNFKSKSEYTIIDRGEVSARCGSNIALVKYWGKYGNQIPRNTSMSYTLKNSYTKTTITFEKAEVFSVELFLSGEKQANFTQKIERYFLSIVDYVPFIDKYKYTIHTENTFPHSSGIASSASGFGAIARCIMEMSVLLGEELSEENKLEKASFLARLGSGSACRSIYEGLVVWGEHSDIEESSNLYGVPYKGEVAPVFQSMNDAVILIHEGQKDVSSTVGHKLMDNHPYANNRFNEAQKNLRQLMSILRSGDIHAFGQLIEHEALTLHGLMMMSNPPFILMKPNTVLAINDIWEYRKETGKPFYFTLDAGANIHLFYPSQEKELAEAFINNKLKRHTQSGGVILDKT